MSDSKIICPSCGAENKYGGKCEFCGATLDSGDSTSVYNSLLGDAQDSEDILFRTTVDRYENTTIIEFIERPGKVVEYYRDDGNDRYQYSSTTYGDDANGKDRMLFFADFYSEQVANGIHKLFVKRTVEAIMVDDVVYKLDNNTINCDVLKALCEGQSISFKGYEESLDTDIIRKSARIFYNRVIDSYLYNEEVQEEIKFRKEIEEYNKEVKITLKAEYEAKINEEVKQLEKEEKYNDIVIIILFIIFVIIAFILCVI